VLAILIVSGVLAFYLAWNVGANDVANSMGTSVGSKTVTLRQALVIAGVLEFAGAILFGKRVSSTLAASIVSPAWFSDRPSDLLAGMVVVLVTCGLWLNVATFLGLPVSSSHAIVGAIAGFGWVAAGHQAIHWQVLGTISLAWVLTPIISGAIAALLYLGIQHFILRHPHPLTQLQEWLPWLSALLIGIFGVLVLPTVSAPLQTWLNRQGWAFPAHDLPLLLGAIAIFSLTLLNRLSYSQDTLPAFANPETVFARFQLVSACFVAFAHGSNDVGNAIAPLVTIAHILQTNTLPTVSMPVPLWCLLLGGSGIVAGLAIWGKHVITTIGTGIIPLYPSGGFCAELATATTVLLASKLGLPVSTSHALVGGVIGIGLVQTANSLQFATLRNILAAWVTTIPLAAGCSAALFAIARQLLL
jgi:PiT family inorganic phosphate transporter